MKGLRNQSQTTVPYDQNDMNDIHNEWVNYSRIKMQQSLDSIGKDDVAAAIRQIYI